MKLILVFLFLSTFVQAGDEMGNGGGFRHLNQLNVTWFQERDREINYCFKAHRRFSNYSDYQLKEIIDKSIKVWVNYLTPIVDSNADFKDGGMSLNFVYQERCKRSTDLKFFFGHKNSTVDKLLRTRHRNSVAFAESKTSGEAWNPGIIFIRSEGDEKNDVKVPDWSRDNRYLMGMVIHELGHVFGIDHFNHTIMREDIAPFIDSMSSIAHREKDTAKLLLKIDHDYSLSPNGVNIEGNKVSFSKERDHMTFNNIDGALSKFTPSGERGEANEGYESITFSSSSVNNRTSDITYVTNRRCIGRSYQLSGKFGDIKCLAARFERFSLQGSLSFLGQDYPAIYKKNLNLKRHQVSIFKDGKWVEVFVE